MSTEVERKFILPEPPPALPMARVLRQGYLAEERDVEVRVRLDGERAALTVKAGRGLSRTEVELPLDAAQFDTLWAHTAGRRVEKMRSEVALPDGHLVEVDVYSGALSGLCVAEVEFASEAAARAFPVPRWFGREVTGDAAWTNAALARHDRSDNSFT